jgi:hypothetical protein
MARVLTEFGTPALEYRTMDKAQKCSNPAGNINIPRLHDVLYTWSSTYDHIKK